MAEMYLVRKDQGVFVCDDQQSLDRAKKVKYGQVIRVDYKKPRNYRFHKKYFELITLSFENQDKYDAFEAFRDAVTMHAGWYATHISLTGETIYKPKSISFANMDDLEFGELYKKTINVILKYVMTETTEQEIIERLVRF